MGMKRCMEIYLIGILFTSWIICTTENRIRHQKFEEDNDPFLTEEVDPDTLSSDIIDLDDINSDVTSIDKNQRKTTEDTRELGVAPTTGDRNGHHDDINDDVIPNDTDFLSPIPLSESTETHELINVTLPFNTSDDEDLSSGSGSGDIVIEIQDGDELLESTTTVANLEDKTIDVTESPISDDIVEAGTDEVGIMFGGKLSHFYEYDSEDVEYIENTTDTAKLPEEQSDLPMYCVQTQNVTWSSWSPWIQAGDVDIRFRSCPVEYGYKHDESPCPGDYFEKRKCGQTDERVCRTEEGVVTEQFQTQCSGMIMEDMKAMDELWTPARQGDDCEFTLYDLQYNMAIGNPVSAEQLQTTDANMWCFSDDKFVPFYTPTERCQNILKGFCTKNERCKYDTTTKQHSKDKGDLHRKCWTDFVLGRLLPTGFPLGSGQQMICQKFDKDSQLGKLFGHKTSQFGTMYDTEQRLPVYSMVTVRSLGDDKWPSLPFMIDRGLIKEEGSTISWFFKEKKKGITRLQDLNIKCTDSMCQYGERQALPSDYELSRYRTAPLLTPDLIGWDLSRRVSTFTMTNTAPMDPTIYQAWKRVMKVIREFAINDCHIPVNSDNYSKGKPHNGYELPELYLIAGAAAPMATDVEYIGNDVTVPELFWISACCAHGAAVSSFGVYLYNNYEQQPIAVSVENLQMLLQANYYDNVDVINIKLYPAFDGVCTGQDNDVSSEIDLK